MPLSSLVWPPTSFSGLLGRETRIAWFVGVRAGLEPRSASGPGLDPGMKRRRCGGRFLFRSYSCTRVPGLPAETRIQWALRPGRVERPPAGIPGGSGRRGEGVRQACALILLPPTPPSADTSRPHPRDAPGKFGREGARARAAPAPTAAGPQTMGARGSPGRPGEPPHAGLLRAPSPSFPARSAYGARSGVPGCG